MARPIRVEFPDAVYHVTARGNERQPIVREDPDRERFLETLQQMVQRFGVAIHAYCLMQVIPSPWDDLRQGLVLGGKSLWNRARELLDQAGTRRPGVKCQKLTPCPLPVVGQSSSLMPICC